MVDRKPDSVLPKERTPFLWDLCHHRPQATYPSAGPGQSSPFSRHADLFGLAPRGVYRARPVTGPAVGSYPTLSPLPDPQCGHRRSALCCTVRRVTPPRRYLARCPAGNLNPPAFVRSPDFPLWHEPQRRPGPQSLIPERPRIE